MNLNNVLSQKYDGKVEREHGSQNPSLSLNYKKQFDDKSHNLYVDASYTKRNSEEDGWNRRNYYPIYDGDTL
jgi:hypothetical protein